jgi:hypothetical protein
VGDIGFCEENTPADSATKGVFVKEVLKRAPAHAESLGDFVKRIEFRHAFHGTGHQII